MPFVQGAFYAITTEILPPTRRATWLGPLYALCQLIAFGFTFGYSPSSDLVPTCALFLVMAAIAFATAVALLCLLPETRPTV